MTVDFQLSPGHHVAVLSSALQTILSHKAATGLVGLPVSEDGVQELKDVSTKILSEIQVGLYLFVLVGRPLCFGATGYDHTPDGNRAKRWQKLMRCHEKRLQANGSLGGIDGPCRADSFLSRPASEPPTPKSHHSSLYFSCLSCHPTPTPQYPTGTAHRCTVPTKCRKTVQPSIAIV